jgi:c-di-GMP-binding flagellar brake protein YcgR
MAANEFQQSPKAASDPDRLRSPEVIASMLMRLHETRTLVEVQVPGVNQPQLSAVIGVNTAEQYLLLDELKSTEAHQRLLQIARLTLRASIKGIDLSFEAPVVDVGVMSGAAFYKTAFPRELLYHQRRSSYRAHVGLAQAVPVSFKRDIPESMLTGMLQDISLGGIGARITARLPQGIKRGELLPDCAIELPSGIVICSSLEVRHIDPARQRQPARVGGRFVDLDAQQRKVVQRFVIELERELIRKQPKE